MKKYPLLMTLFTKTNEEFTEGLTDLFISREFFHFTLWEIDGGTICKPQGGNLGISEGTFDIFDLGYDGSDSFHKELSLQYFGKTYPIYAGFFCHVPDRPFIYAITFHQEIPADAYTWIRALQPFIAMRAESLKGDEHRMEIFVDYQKKIDFIKESGLILKAIALNDVLVNALNFFGDTFHSEVCCTMLDTLFVGFGIAEEDVQNNIFVGEQPLTDYLAMNSSTEYIDQDIQSPKFEVNNVFIIRDATSGATFLLFNITVDIVPDKEFAELISHIVAIAVENARYYERATSLKVEAAEMSQTVEILNQFVTRETEKDGVPKIFSANYSAKSTGGDFTTVTDTDDYIFICVADVCGKGYSAAVFTVMLAAIMESGLCKDVTDIGALADGINRYIISHKFNDRFITGFLCHYDKHTHILKYISCGHEPTMLLTADGTQRLTSLNVPLGILDDSYTVHEVTINDGDFLFIYTDGVIEYINHDELQTMLEEDDSTTPKEVVSNLYRRLVQNPEEQRDDFTCVAVKF
ncbi:MAG: serine/threonine-protein phosphatase [Deferribacteraceae bacterium]|jgi:serine phosphatase RsbU (regulator of sigma subunit)|nr:serine/threonine-protein phosphatase [Deferribacteraceae bacterium]